MGVALMIVALLASVYALVMIRVFWKRREYAKAVAAGKWLLVGVALYLAALIAVSVATPPKVASGSEELRLCDALGDCSLAVYVLEVEQKRTLGNPPQEMISSGVYYIVTVKVTSYAANPKFAPGDLTAFVVDDSGRAVWLVDPGINGVFTKRADGSEVRKFDAPKATLMSYIIKGILDRRLPWGLVLFGVMIAIVLEMSNIPSLAFAVGVYLPLSSSSPIFIGGMVRWLVDSYLRKKHRAANLTEEQLVAEGDKSPGVLMASGYIAGGAIAGIIIAFMAGVLSRQTQWITNWAEQHNPFFQGPYADLLSLIPFAVLVAILYSTGREIIFSNRPKS